MIPLLAFGLPSPEGALAQSVDLAATPAWTSEEVKLTLVVALGDIDVDGDLDLVCGNWDDNSTLYLNAGGILSPTPDWESERTDSTRSVALGDIDNDGDLDLVCGNWGQSNALYLNEGGVLSTTPAWRSHPASATFSIALGDVNDDGYLDLVCGNSGHRNALYLNEGGVLSTTPTWESQPFNRTRSVALGDVNGDGDLDLICGNWGQSNTLYLNEDGVLSTTPAWSSESAENTWGVVLGDINGDGDLDLVCGNSEQCDALYLNEGGGLSPTPAWSSELSALTHSIALGDLDGDGDLDLVCGDYNDSNVLYVNEGGMLSGTPAWSSELISATTSIALGDLDGDGDLDVFCGKPYQGNTLYLNECPALSTTPASSSDDPHLPTQSVALGDLDGDGDLDLVCGNSNQSNTVYKNEQDVAGKLEMTPFWSSEPSNDTYAVAFGDINGDGYLDLVCGNFMQKDVMYKNEGGIRLSPTPAWESERLEANHTYAVALGDIDGDGDLDLVCGRSIETDALYRNEAGALQTSPDWISEAAEGTYAVALGDVDGDGDLDLFCGSRHGQNHLYRNEEGVLSPSPTWWSGPNNVTHDIALGDIDGDGYLDLVCGNVTSNTLYLNDGGALPTLPDWYSDAEETTTAVALGDVDGDGDLDLVCGNANESNTLYRNDAGMLSRTPVAWSPEAINTNSIALGDLDGDGDLDLVCGNLNGASTFYVGLSSPVFKGDPLDPKNHLPNNGACLYSVRITALEENVQRIAFTALDVESDPVWIVPEYQFDGDPTFFPLDVDGPLGPFATSPAGIEHELTWDILRVSFDRRDVVLRLRAVSMPRSVSHIQYVAAYLKDVGRIIPRRPELTTSPSLLSFPTVTVGDTVSAVLTLFNSGTEPLSIESVVLPSTEMSLAGVQPPFNLGAGGSLGLTVNLEPRHELGVSGEIVIESNDPLTPTSAVAVETDIRALDIMSRLLVSEEEAPLGVDLTVLVTPADAVRVERGNVYYAIEGTEGFDSTPLGPLHEEFVAIIPGDHVTEAGLRYYIEVENSGVTNTDPPGAPYDSVFVVPVHVPVTVASSPQPTSGDDFLEGREIRVQLLPQEGTIVQGGSLHYRQGGETAYDVSSIETDVPRPFAIVPDSIVGSRGVEYWMEIHTLTSTLTDPAGDPVRNPHVIRTTVPRLSEGRSFPGNAYRMVSVPLDFGADFTGTLQALLSDQAPFGVYDPLRWRSFRWETSSGQYAELSPDEPAHIVKPGRAFWLISRQSNSIDTAPVQGTSTATDSAHWVKLSSGWNQIGNPFNFTVSWDAVLVDTLTADGAPVTLTMAEAESTVLEPPVGWTVNVGSYEYDVRLLQPFDGYWVRSTSALVLHIPPREAAPDSSRVVTSELARSDDLQAEDEWRIQIRAASGDARDPENFAGVTRGAMIGWDHYDRAEPPMVPGKALSLYFPHGDWGRSKGPYAADVRGDYQPFPASVAPELSRGELWGHVWRLDVAKNFSASRAGDGVLLEFVGIQDVPDGAAICLVDRHRLTVVDLNEDANYTFYLGEKDAISDENEARFILLVGSDAFIAEHDDQLPGLPRATVLHANSPNPFNPSTVICYDIARAGEIDLTIHDIAGSLVRRLHRGYRKPGRYEIAWDGRDEIGARASSGIYFSRLRTDHRTVCRKLVMLR
jgi:hypothetical protein